MRAKILVVDDCKETREIIGELFSRQNAKVAVAEDGIECLKKVEEFSPDVIILDLMMPGMDGLEVMEELQAMGKEPIIVVLSARRGMESTVKAMKLGAFDYITKPFELSHLRDTVRKALRINRLKEEQDKFEDIESPDDTFVGNSPQIREIYKQIGIITRTDNSSSVLITGESGTGKELVARIIHENSRPGKPFVVIDCNLIPENLLESELFGYEKGAFTGADSSRAGKFEMAHNGTILLDEIGDMTPYLQQKLLRVLQNREFERIGGRKTLYTNARFIFATNKNIRKLVDEKRFREDLFYRINVFHIHLPPLRERNGDTKLLVHHFIKQFAARFRTKKILLSPGAERMLLEYDYPGNIRELEHIIERAVGLAKEGVILPEHLPDIPRKVRINRKTTLQKVDKKLLTQILKRHNGNITHSARELGIHRQSLQRIIKRYNINPQRFRKAS